MSAIDYLKLRTEMVNREIVGHGIKDPLAVNAMQTVPRERFVSEELSGLAYENTPLPIGAGQTISQPFIVALMVEALRLKGGETILEIGTGSGYAAAVLAQIAGQVYSVERIKELTDVAAAALRSLNYTNINLVNGDGTKGHPEKAPYDAIVVAASGPKVPGALKQQLKVGGRLVIPVGLDGDDQQLKRITRINETEFKSENLEGVRFVPLIGAHGWPPK